MAGEQLRLIQIDPAYSGPVDNIQRTTGLAGFHFTSAIESCTATVSSRPGSCTGADLGGALSRPSAKMASRAITAAVAIEAFLKRRPACAKLAGNGTLSRSEA
jgi:hypothetical protein